MELPCSFLTPADLWVALFSFGPVLLLGVPALLKTRQPREIALEPVADDALPPSLRRWLSGLDARFSALGYQCAGTWRATNLPNQTAVMRSWWSSSEAPIASATTLLDVRGDSQLGQSWLEFSTLHADGTLVGTATLRRSRFRRRYHTAGKMHDAPGLGDPEALKRRHERDCAPYLARGPRFLALAEVLPEILAFLRRDAAFRRKAGLWKSYPEGDGPTLRGAILLSLDALAPITAEVGPARLLAVLAIALGLPALAEGPLVASALLPAGLGRAAALVGALGLGALIGTRGVFWGPLLLHIGLRLAGAEPGNAFFFVASSQAAALAASSFASRLRSRL